MINEVIVYVEGSSDKYALEMLFRNLRLEKQSRGIKIHFIETMPGDKKISVIMKSSKKAISILQNKASAEVVLMPDLYPINVGFKHTNYNELANAVREYVKNECEKGNIRADIVLKRLKVFCFQYDLESLILASKNELETYLKRKIIQNWNSDIESQNKNRPPKRIVEDIFRQAGKTYHPTVDIPGILKGVSYKNISRKLPNSFGLLANYLEYL